MTFELNIIKWLQDNRNGFFDILFEVSMRFGEDLMIIGILGLVYWSINKEYGKRLAITILISAGLNSVLKVAFARPRPFLVDNDITNLRSNITPSHELGYAMPSGHTQSASTTFFGLNYYFKKKYLLIFAIIITLLVAIARMYIGVHYLTDVIVGGLLGIAMVYGVNYLIERIKDPKLLYRIIGALAFVFLIIFVIIEFVKANSGSTFAGNLFYSNLETMPKMIGALVGFVVGIEIEQIYVKFSNHRNLKENIIRFLLGVVLLFLIRIALKELFSLMISTENLQNAPVLSLLAIVLDFLRYFIMVVFGIGIYPFLFKKFNF
ncbi:MAG: phosphatase PAP2 family protein [Candidatus Izemoplasmatales bacterium]